jgi:antitoxin component YwqK of YwqJK toxin-antitoxin module
MGMAEESDEQTNCIDEHGLKQGVWQKYHENGQLQYEGYYDDGEREGVHRMWYPNGQLRIDNNYMDDKEYGTQLWFDEYGRLEYKGYYREGKEIGWWDKDGQRYDAHYQRSWIDVCPEECSWLDEWNK